MTTRVKLQNGTPATRQAKGLRRVRALGFAALAWLMMCLAGVPGAAQDKPQGPQSSGSRSHSAKAGTQTETANQIPVVEIRPFQAMAGKVPTLESSGHAVLLGILLYVVRQDLAHFSRPEDKSEEEQVWQKRASALKPNYEIKPYYVADQSGTLLRVGATLVRYPGAISIGSPEVTIDSKDSNSAIRRLGLQLGLSLRSDLGHPVPSYTLHIHCFSFEGKSTINEMAVKLARQFAISSLNESELVKSRLVMLPNESCVGKVTSGTNEFYVEGKIFAQVIQSSGPTREEKVQYFLELDLYYGQQQLNAMKPRECEGWEVLPQTATEAANALSTSLDDPTFIDVLLNRFRTD